jgi:hypothetical protein
LLNEPVDPKDSGEMAAKIESGCMSLPTCFPVVLVARHWRSSFAKP